MIVNNQKESKDCVWWYFQVVPPQITTLVENTGIDPVTSRKPSEQEEFAKDIKDICWSYMKDVHVRTASEMGHAFSVYVDNYFEKFRCRFRSSEKPTSWRQRHGED